MTALLLLILLGAEPNAPRLAGVPTFPLTSLLDVEGVCRVEPDWQMYRAEQLKDKSCEEYAKALTKGAMEGMHTSTVFLAYLSLCWLMDPCSKAQP